MSESAKAIRTRGRPYIDYPLIFAGNLIYALSVVMFNRPSGIPLGGFSGIAMIINYLWALPMGAMIMVLNIPLFIVSFKTLGRRFFIRTLAATIVSSSFIDLLTPFLSGRRITEDPMLSALYGGVLAGLGMGIVFSRGATTGGSEILSKMINRRFQHYSIGKISLTINAAVILCAALVFGRIESVLYAMIVQFVSAMLVDTIINGFDHASAAIIVTSDPDKMSEMILKEMHRGCTGLNSVGMYTKAEHTTLLVAVRNHESSMLKRLVSRCDPNAFIIMLNAREVIGHGFKSYGQ